MGAAGIRYITVYFLFVFILIFHGLCVLWPPNRDRDVAGESIASVLKLNKDFKNMQKELTQNALTPTPTPTATPTPAPTPTPTPGEPSTPGMDTGMDTDLGTDQGTDFGAAEQTTSPSPSASASPSPSPPPSPAPGQAAGECGTCPQGQEPAELFWIWCLCLSSEERLLLIVMFGGALGGLVHALRSFYWYLGNRSLVTSWAGMYVSLPVTGAAMGTLFYLVVRGGFFSPQSTISDTSPFGFAAMAALVGMFTEQAALKLREIAGTLFSQAEKGKDHVTNPKLKISPAKGPKAGGTVVRIEGSNFANTTRVSFGGQPATVAFKNATLLEATTPAVQAAGPVAVEVTNPDGTKDSLDKAFTYE